MSKQLSSPHFYKCDPEKNRFCRKNDCYLDGGSCALTTHQEFSTNGRPLDEDEGWHRGVSISRRVRREKNGK